ncbi:MAG: T9SS type A sorting domain-containing protein [Pedobacter sp.]|uniref:T9SS type A sorting domain-containing protein n=1 Tax=Pedobacter sp. TaxID=1411316 RepID=UPI0028092886|nr:T9SS type A sorting domain-containing protein [Pedobacter sp.]MDQ8005120.1 T9SS type A sorting domain-containing protein [Pedobacter sp.]
MKKLLLSFAFLAIGVAASAQTLLLNTDWYKLRRDAEVVFGTTQERSSIAYNKSTDKLYLVDRNNKIQILNPATGALASPSELPVPTNLAATWPESYKFNKLRVADDGAIYAINLAINTDANNRKFCIYRWASETDANPTRVEWAVTIRKGDSFAVTGTGSNTKLYVGGSGNAVITVFGVDAGGTVSQLYEMSTTTNNHARGSISPISANEFVINGPSSVGIRKVTLNVAGTDIDNSQTTTFLSTENIFSNAEYFVNGTKKYVALSGSVIGGTPTNNAGVKFKLFDITTLASPVYLSYAELFPETPTAVTGGSNPNGYADVAIKRHANGTHTFFHLVFAHGLASYTTTVTLPVSLTSFNAALVNGQSTLAWETASETNNKGFEVLRSTDGKDFTKIGFVDSKGQNGNSSTALSYSYVDRTAKAGVNYYQLKQIDLNGDNELFKDVKSVNVSLNGSDVVVFPNPATTYVTVSAGSADFKDIKYEVFDASGKKVLSEKATAEQQDISLSKLPASIYFLKISKNGDVQKTVKLVKQ